MRTRLPGSTVSRLRGRAAVIVVFLAVAGLAAYAGAAGAAPPPTVAQVRQQVNSLTARLDRAGQQYDQAAGQLPAARGRLAQVRREAAAAQARYTVARAKAAQTAAGSFEDPAQASVAGLLTSGDPSALLGQASMLLRLTDSRHAQTRQFLADARRLSGVQQELQRTEYGIAALTAQLAAHKRAIRSILATQQTTLASLTTPQQQAQVAAGTIGAAGTTSATYTGPTTTQAGQAVAFAYAQLGKPYVWGAAGPAAYDCSGLVQAAWAAAGVAIPRVTYDQWAALQHIPASAMQPGDLLYFDGEGHVTMYIGGGYMIDAPRTGLTVEKVPLNTSWYAATFDGAVRP